MTGAVADDDTQRILHAYEIDNQELRARVKQLERHLASGEPGLKAENQTLRRKLLELQPQSEAAENYERLQEEHINFVREAKEREMNLREQFAILQVESTQLKEQIGNWNADETQNQSILSALNSVREAILQSKGVDAALDNFTAMVAPDVLVRRDRELSAVRRQSRLSPRRDLLSARERQEFAALKEEFEALKTKMNAPRTASRLPAPRRPSQKEVDKIRELESKMSDLEQKYEEAQRSNTSLKARAKERSQKMKELKDQVISLQEELLDVRRKHQVEIADQAAEKANMQSQLKALQANAEYRVEYEKARARVEVLEAENTELKKPRPTGDAALDRVLDAMARLEGDFQQRQSELSRFAMHIEDKFEEEKREMEGRHRREIDEKNHQLRRLKAEFEAILADLEHKKKK
jgi:DNA repair exonuclease SbcCD ATPase subunit